MHSVVCDVVLVNNNNNMHTMANFTFLTIAYTSFKAGFRYALYVSYIRIFAKNLGNPYMSPLSWFMILNAFHSIYLVVERKPAL